jgi:hypothetical protein
MMNRRTFRHAISRGLGSVILFLQDHPQRAHKYVEIILNHCINNTAYDAQSESRIEYLWEVILASTKIDYLKNKILDAMKLASGDDLSQMYQLAALFAKNGHSDVIQTMKQQFRYDEYFNHFIGGSELVEVNGLVGFNFVLEQIGQYMKTNPEYFDSDLFLEEAKQILGDETVKRFLSEFSQTYEYVSIYLERLPVIPKRETVNGNEMSFEEVQGMIQHEPFGWGTSRLLSKWGQSQATPEQLDWLVQHFSHEKNEKREPLYLSVFLNHK